MRDNRWPRELDRDAYERVRRRFVDRLVATGQVRSVAQMRDFGSPGLSRLDLVVVVTDPVAAGLPEVACLRGAGEEARYVLGPGPLVLNEDLFRRIDSLVVACELRHVLGDSLERQPVSAAEARVLRFVFNFETMLAALARLARVLPADAPFPVRPTLAALQDVRRSVALAREWMSSARAERYATSIDALRARWFELSRPEAWAHALAASREAVVVLGELIDGLAPFAQQLCGGAAEPGTIRALEVHEVHRFGPGPCSYELCGNRPGAAAPGRPRRMRRIAPHRAPLLELRLPAAYFGFYALEAAEFANLGTWGLARRIAGPLPRRPRPELVDAIRKRATTIADLHAFVARNRLRGAAYPIPLAWQRPLPWKQRVKARLMAAVGVGRLPAAPDDDDAGAQAWA